MFSFNSIKVQLRREPRQCIIAISDFQFHKGTIKARGLYKYFWCSEYFQFHKGTIKAPDLSDLSRLPDTSFNSIKVQLRHVYTHNDK